MFEQVFKNIDDILHKDAGCGSVVGKYEKSNGALYTEIIKDSTLLERAKLHNKIFIKELEKGN